MTFRGYDPSLENIDALRAESLTYSHVCGESVESFQVLHPKEWLRIENQKSWPSCFPAGTMVLMADGTERDIADIAVGNWVITHTGDSGRVTNKTVRRHTGTLKKITTGAEYRPILCTPDHKIYFAENNAWIEAKSLVCKDHLLAVQRTQSHQFNKQRISVLDYLSTDAMHDEESDTCRMVMAKDGYSIPATVTLNEQFGRLVGLYLAEGGVHKGPDGNPREIVLTFHIDEVDFRNDAADALRDIFGVTARVKLNPERNTAKVECSNVTLAEFFYCFCGKRIDTKHVPIAILNAADQKCRQACLRGWIDGDGHVNNDRIAGSGNVVLRREVCAVSVSEKLAITMRRLAMDLGYSPNIKARTERRDRRQAYTLGFYGLDAERVAPGQYPERAKPQSRRCRPHRYGHTRPVKSVEDVTFDGLVYDITVEGDHSYTANGIAVHNCGGHALSTVMEWLYYLATEGQVVQLSRLFAWVAAQKAGGGRASQSNGVSIYGCAKAAKETGLPEEDLAPYKVGEWRSEFAPEVYANAAEHKCVNTVVLETADDCFDFLAGGVGGIEFGVPWEFNRGSWHAVAGVGVPVDDKICIANSWGPDWDGDGWTEWSHAKLTKYMGISGTVAIGFTDMDRPHVRKGWDASRGGFA